MSTPNYLVSIHHDGSPRYVRPAARRELRLGDDVTIRLRAALDAPIERILLRTCPDGEQFFTEMQPADAARAGVPPACRWWQATLRLNMPVTTYRFLLFTADGVWWYNGSGLHRHVPTDAEDFRLLADYTAPAWLHDQVFYQIFPDRFADGDPANNVRDGEFEYRDVRSRAKRWGEPLGRGLAALVEFYGGDLPGVEQRLDYLADLGVSAIYLNPIFTAYSNHRYDGIDYNNVDPHLGGNQALISLRRATAARGMRLVLDIVPNHCGVMHPWFQAVLADRNALTAEFFTFRHYPDDYECWLGVRSLPRLNFRSQAVRDAIYAGPDAIFRHWLRAPYAIDGWRIDVANMLGRQGADQLAVDVGRGIRQAVKEENAAAYLMGENFFDGSPQLQGDTLDATMNYAGFTSPLIYWLTHFRVGQHAEPREVISSVRWPTQALVDTWRAHRAAIPWAIARQQFNLLGSHDTPRIRSLLAGDRERVRLAIAILLTYVGTPCIYYGDEVGLGEVDSFEARQCMAWEHSAWDAGLRSYCQSLIRLRRTSPVLIEGGFQVLSVEENVLAYLRDTDDAQMIVVGNRGSDVRPAGPLPVAHGGIPDGMEFRELFSGQCATVVNGCLPLPAVPAGVQIWCSS